MSTVELAPEPAADRQPNVWIERLDAVTLRASDWLNPILIKEARQALKSRQFVITFTLLLIAAWGWTLVAILLMMPRILFIPSGDTLLRGYYLVLAVPMLLVVPLAAHRSLASEVDDGTLDLLSVTNLSPMQIISGKLASAALQMMLYFVALFPCVAFSYVLRGIDLPSIVGLLGLTISIGILLTVLGLFLAALPKGRAGQLVMLVILLVIEVIAEFAFGGMAMEIIDGSVFQDLDMPFFVITVIAILLTVTAALVMLRAAAAQLAPPSENRSTPIRAALIWHQGALILGMVYPILQWGRDDTAVTLSLYYMAFFWLIIGSMMVGESPVLTPRVRREMPSSFLTRSFIIWLTPGPATGLIFAMCMFITYCAGVLIARTWTSTPTAIPFGPLGTLDPLPHMITLGGYLALILTLTRLAMAALRRHSHVTPAVALAVVVIVAGTLAGGPYSIALWWNDYREFDWTYWQLTNWVWTIGELTSQSLPDQAPYFVAIIGGTAWSIALVTMGRRVLPLRVATPERVLAELKQKTSSSTPSEEPLDPLAI